MDKVICKIAKEVLEKYMQVFFIGIRLCIVFK
jgi:hypothetical protein